MPTETHLASLEPHLNQHERELDLLLQRADTLAAELGAKGAARREPGAAASKRKPAGVAEKEPVPRKVLQAEQQEIKRSIATHRKLIRFGRDKRVGKVLADVAADPQLAREAAVDPVAFAAARGIELPEQTRLSMTVDDQGVTLRVAHLDPDMPFVLVWTQDGFQPPTVQEEREPEPEPESDGDKHKKHKKGKKTAK